MPFEYFLCLFWMREFVLFARAVNPACECVMFDGRTRPKGRFTSPNFPQIYPTNINCILYKFVGHVNQIVELTFFEFDLPLPATTKCSHFARLFLDLERPEVNELNRWEYELCGNLSNVQSRYFSSTPNLILEFHSDHIPTNHSGFRGVYNLIDKGQFDVIGGNRQWGAACNYDFYSNKTTKSGNFFSPRYPQNYPPSSRCQYFFYGTVHERVNIVFHTVQLEPIDGSCEASPDYIIVRDGLDPTRSPTLARLCNEHTSVQYTSTRENLVVELNVDNKKQRQGFSASYVFISSLHHPDPISSPLPFSAHLDPETKEKIPPAGSSRIDPEKWDNLDANKGDFNGDNPGDSPDVNYTQKLASDRERFFPSTERRNGTFTSPNYPDPYPAEVTVRYVFQGQGQERVQVVFTDLDLNYSQETLSSLTEDCEESDSVTVTVTMGGQPKDIGVYCGSKRPPMLMSSGTQLEITFVSRSLTVAAKGFNASYSFVTDYGIKTGQQDPKKSCLFEFRSETVSNGTFTSPNFPGLYPCNTECHYLFHGSDYERIHISFPYFDVDGIPPGCLESTQSDYVEFSNFNVDLIDRKMNRLCGTKENHFQKYVNSDGSFFRVTFKSNDAYHATGFEAFFQFRKFEEPFKPSTKSKFLSGGERVKPSVATSLLLLIVSTLCVNTIVHGDLWRTEC